MHQLSEEIAYEHWFGTPCTTVKVKCETSDRVVAIDSTLRLAEQKARLAGVSRVGSITGLDSTDIPAYSAVRPNSEAGNISVLGGKGVSKKHALVSALMEAIERHAGEKGSRNCLTATHEEYFDDCEMIDPISLILSENSVYSRQDEIEWYQGFDVVSRRKVWIPAVAVFNPYRNTPYLFAANSNGLASGNTIPEAFLHAIYEVAERDGTTFAERMGLSRSIDIDKVTGHYPLKVIAAFQKAGIEVVLRFMKAPCIGYSVMVIIDEPAAADPMLINAGFGFHLNPQTALTRALSEAALSRSTVIAGVRDNLGDEAARRELGYAELRQAVDKMLSNPQEAINFSTLPDLSTDTITGDLQKIVESIVDEGFSKVLVVDLTDKDLNVPVVRVIVPGMELGHIEMDRCGPRYKAMMRAG